MTDIADVERGGLVPPWHGELEGHGGFGRAADRGDKELAVEPEPTELIAARASLRGDSDRVERDRLARGVAGDEPELSLADHDLPEFLLGAGEEFDQEALDIRARRQRRAVEQCDLLSGGV